MFTLNCQASYKPAVIVLGKISLKKKKKFVQYLTEDLLNSFRTELCQIENVIYPSSKVIRIDINKVPKHFFSSLRVEGTNYNLPKLAKEYYSINHPVLENVIIEKKGYYQNKINICIKCERQLSIAVLTNNNII